MLVADLVEVRVVFHNGGRGADWKYRKLDLPLFDGSNQDGWILRAERNFKFFRLYDEEKVEVPVVSLDGDTLS